MMLQAIIDQLLEKPLLKFTSLQPLTLFTITVFVIFLYKWLQLKSQPKKNLPPSPPKLPILGNLLQLGTHPHRSLQSLSEQHGELVLITIGTTPNLVVSSARAAREIMVTHDIIFSDRPTSKKANKLLYNRKDVAAAPYGEYWRQMKAICVVQLLSSKMVRSFRRVREEETALIIAKIMSAGSLVTVNLSEVFMDFTNDVICRVAFGRKYREKENGINFNKLINEYTKVLGEFTVGEYVPWLGWIDRFNGWDVKVDKIVQQFDQFIEKVVTEHQFCKDHGSKNSKNRESDENVKDFVDVLLDVQSDRKVNFTLDRDGIKAVILDMFTAGTDTTSTVLEWAMSELITHPRVMKELQNEVRTITGDKSDVSEDDLEQMSYLKAVIKETLRLHPSSPLLIPRISTQDANICGYDIPADTEILINAWAIHRDSKYWIEPETFNPDRFMNSVADFRGKDCQFIPFGGGRRMCPGIVFAMANTELLLAKLMFKFDWMLPGGAKGESLDMSDCFGLTVKRKTPLIVVGLAK